MKVAIVGYDVEGRSSYDYFAAQGHEIEIRDQNDRLKVPDDVKAVLGHNYLDGLDEFDLIIRTAGLSPHKIIDRYPDLAGRISTNVDTFLANSPTKNIIGVTGTKGKGTTSTLISKMLETAGKSVTLGGNIGVAPLDFIDKLGPDSWVVLELSSFQLIDLQHSPHTAVCLMVVPEHLDWHPSVEEYYHAKSQLFAHQGTADVAIYFAPNEASRLIAAASPGHLIPYFEAPGAVISDGAIVIDGQTICRTNELKLLGVHNWQNVCAAVTAVWQVGVRDVSVLRSVLTAFSGLPYRLELVRELNGVRYYNDSFGTTPETAMVAIEAFDQPEIIILGGHAKGIPFTELAEFIAVRDNVKKVITIGEAGPEIASELRQAGYQDVVSGGRNIDEIAELAQDLAAPGDVVVFSTACASFDMFDNYQDRGQQFTAAVQALA